MKKTWITTEDHLKRHCNLECALEVRLNDWWSDEWKWDDVHACTEWELLWPWDYLPDYDIQSTSEIDLALQLCNYISSGQVLSSSCFLC